MEALNSLLQELAAREQRLVKQWKAVLKRRDIEDLDYQLRKDAENAVWQQRFLDRDSEEDETLQKKRELTRGLPTTPAKALGGAGIGGVLTPAATTPGQEDRLPPRVARAQASPSVQGRKHKGIYGMQPDDDRHGHPTTYDDTGHPLYTRPSDGRLIYLRCCITGCDKADFRTVHGLMCHIARPTTRNGHGLKGFLKNHRQALLTCGLAAEDQSTNVTTDRNRQGSLAGIDRRQIMVEEGESSTDEDSILGSECPQQRESSRLSRNEQDADLYGGGQERIQRVYESHGLNRNADELAANPARSFQPVVTESRIVTDRAAYNGLADAVDFLPAEELAEEVNDTEKTRKRAASAPASRPAAKRFRGRGASAGP